MNFHYLLACKINLKAIALRNVLLCKSTGVIVVDDHFLQLCFDWERNAGMYHFVFP